MSRYSCKFGRQGCRMSGMAREVIAPGECAEGGLADSWEDRRG